MNLADEYRATRAALRRLTPDELDKPKVNSMISSMSYSIEWIETGIRPGTVRGIERRAGYEREVPSGLHINAVAACDPISVVTDLKDQLRLELALQGLTEREKECLKLSIGEGYSYAEIADMLGITRGSVQTYIDRGRMKAKKESLSRMG